MKKSFLILSMLAVCFLCGCDSCEVVRVTDGKLHFSDGKMTDIPHWGDPEWTIFFFVRHAEKLDDSDDTDLSPEGYTRAERLGVIMENTGLDFVFATDKRRTQKTAEKVQIRARTPPVIIYSRDDAAETAFLTAQLAANRGKHLFVVGHSNTVPRMVNKLVGESSTLTDLDEGNFSAFYIVASRSLGDSEFISKIY